MTYPKEGKNSRNWKSKSKQNDSLFETILVWIADEIEKQFPR